MHKDFIKSSIKKLVSDNADTLVSDLSSGGLDWSIGSITKTIFTPTNPTGATFSVGIECEYVDEYADMTGVSHSKSYATAKRVLVADYAMMVMLSAYGQVRGGEDFLADSEPGETDQQVFDTFVARVVKMFRDNETIPPTTGGYKIEIKGDGAANDRRINAANRSELVTGSGGEEWFSYRELLRFTVTCCGEPSLYD